jgi:hypothetical protein
VFNFRVNISHTLLSANDASSRHGGRSFAIYLEHLKFLLFFEEGDQSQKCLRQETEA